jgi:hypothetical protein
MVTLRQDGWMKICMGITTFEEVQKHTVPETEESVKAEMESVRRSMALIQKIQRQRAAEDQGESAPAEDFISFDEAHSADGSTDPNRPMLE